MRQTGKLDYIEMPAGENSLSQVKEFYTNAFGWKFFDYGPDYAAYSEGLDGGFYQGDETKNAKPLPVLYSEYLEQTLLDVEKAGGTIIRPIFSFPGGRRFHFTDPSGNELAVWSE